MQSVTAAHTPSGAPVQGALGRGLLAQEHAEPMQAPPPALKYAFLFVLLATTVLARFGLRLSETYSIGFGLVGMYGLVAAMLWTGFARLNPAGALLYVAVGTLAGVSLLVNLNFAEWRRAVSLGSWALLLVLYAPFVLGIASSRESRAMWRWLMHWYLLFAVAIAVFGIVQYFVQFVYRAPWLIDFSPLIPEPLRGSGQYNTSNTTGSAFKSNGFFLREPSTLSFYMAFSLVLEWGLWRRKWVMAVLGMGLIVSYSGSGIMILGAAMLVPLGFKMLLRVAAAALGLIAVYVAFGDMLGLDYTINRVHEFGSQHSSAYCRFILPGITVLERIDSNPWVSLLGHGPGTMQKITGSCETTYGKMAFEYGLLGTLAFTVFMLFAVRRSWVPVRAQVALLVYWYLLGGQLLSPDALLVIFLVCAMWLPAPHESVSPSQPRGPPAKAPPRVPEGNAHHA